MSDSVQDLTCKETLDNFESVPPGPHRIAPRIEEPRPTALVHPTAAGPSHLSFGIANVALPPQHRTSVPSLLSGPLLPGFVLPPVNASLARAPLISAANKPKSMTVHLNTSRGATVLQIGKHATQAVTNQSVFLTTSRPMSDIVRPVLSTASFVQAKSVPSPVKSASVSNSPSTQHPQPGQTTPGPSPRPSILRKRVSDLVQPSSTATRKLVFNGSESSATTFSSSQTSSSAVREESPPESATEDTASNHSTVSTSSSQSQEPSTQPINEMSPRKRARKQQFEVTDPAADRARAIISVRSLKRDSDRLVQRMPPSVKAPPLYMLAPPGAQHRNQQNTEKTRQKSKSPAESEKTNSTTTGENEDDVDDNISDISSTLDGRDSITPPLSIFTRHRGPSPLVKKEPKLEENVPKPLYRPRPKLLTGYQLNWFPRKGHFKRYPEKSKRSKASDQKTAPVSALSKMANDKMTWKRLDSWKLDRMEQQVDTVAEAEKSNVDMMESWIHEWQTASQCASVDAKESATITEMALTFIQRNKFLLNNIESLKESLDKCQDHGPLTTKYLHKFVSKRSIRSAKDRAESAVAAVLAAER